MLKLNEFHYTHHDKRVTVVPFNLYWFPDMKQVRKKQVRKKQVRKKQVTTAIISKSYNLKKCRHQK